MSIENIKIVNQILSILVLVSQTFFVLGLIYLVIFYKKKNDKILEFFKTNGLLLAFIISLVATCGSLFFSETAKYPPCELCWFQRIFIYPQVIILGLAVYKKDLKIIPYSLALSIIGLLISAYHNYIYYLSAITPITSCKPGVSCTTKYFATFGYITIPMMAFTGFILIISLLLFTKFYKNSN
jgi:disulfide bond formation protein DsbB